MNHPLILVNENDKVIKPSVIPSKLNSLTLSMSISSLPSYFLLIQRLDCGPFTKFRMPTQNYVYACNSPRTSLYTYIHIYIFVHVWHRRVGLKVYILPPSSLLAWPLLLKFSICSNSSPLWTSRPSVIDWSWALRMAKEMISNLEFDNDMCCVHIYRLVHYVQLISRYVKWTVRIDSK